MSFDLFFQPCRFKGPAVEKKNPFTGEIRPVLANEPLKPEELKAVRKVLTQANAHGPDEYGCYVVGLEDGGVAEVFGDDLETGCMVALRGMTPDLYRFLFDLLKAGHWVMLPATEGDVAITAAPESLTGVPEDYPRVVVCNSVEELAVLLADGFRAWETYRDQIGGER